jgi:2-polyprenyl-3-methyl-5-hydroxy-6-metoxy-1,4-benzoquinol methylase
MNISTMGAFDQWVAALEARHLANLRVPEVTRALRALSSAYVERRRRTSAHGGQANVRGALDSAGKRAAFALFYAPLHFIAVTEVIRALGTARAPKTILDLGCGTGAAGAAWALACQGMPGVVGIDRHPWAIDEAQWTYQQLGVHGRARQGDAGRAPAPRRDEAVVAAYLLNEVPDAVRITIEKRLLETIERGGHVLVIEPIARGIAPWWDDTAAHVKAAGGRADEWRLPIELPPLLQKFDRAAGLNHRELTFRSLFA